MSAGVHGRGLGELLRFRRDGGLGALSLPAHRAGRPPAWRKVYGELAKGSVTRHRLSLTWICCIGSRSGEEQELHSPLLY